MQTKDTKPSSTISIMLEGSLIHMAAKEVSDIYNFPLETACFTSMIVASHAVGSAFCVTSPLGKSLPVPLYGIAEQPSNAGKTSIVEEFYSGYAERAMIINKEIEKEVKDVKSSIDDKVKMGIDVPEFEQKKLDGLAKLPIGVSDPTPEGLESSLVAHGGFFIAYSTEQGLSKTLLGGLYSEGNKKDDLILKAYNGEYHNVVRANRDRITFCGRPYGGVLELSQEGTIARIMESAGSTGISERFLMMREGDLLGHRKYINLTDEQMHGILMGDIKPSGEMLNIAKPKKRTALDQYYNQMAALADCRRTNESPDMFGLQKLKFSPEAWVVVMTGKQYIENSIRNAETRNSYLASMQGKIDLQIMKLAATLHVMDWDIRTHGQVGLEINADTARKAYWVITELFRGVISIAEQGELYGDNAEEAAVLEWLPSISGGSSKLKSMDQIKKALTRKKDSPFRFYTLKGEGAKKVEEAVVRLVAAGKVLEDKRFTKPKYASIE
ncbi:protein of unknown function DUF3987 [Vibrio phage BUCT006]|nr:protein of unknown function DUF3987 [Vibrio phage BUCT006]